MPASFEERKVIAPFTSEETEAQIAESMVFELSLPGSRGNVCPPAPVWPSRKPDRELWSLAEISPGQAWQEVGWGWAVRASSVSKVTEGLKQEIKMFKVIQIVTQ